MTLPCCGFSWAVSGIMMPPAVFSLGVNSLDHNAVVKRSKIHWLSSYGLVKKSGGFGTLIVISKALFVVAPIFRNLAIRRPLGHVVLIGSTASIAISRDRD